VTKRLHFAWVVAGVAFIALLGAAGFRAAPAVLMVPLQEEYGWPRAAISFAVSVNLVLFGLVAPFAAALIERLGMRRVVAGALVLVSAGSASAIFVRDSWQLVLCWGILVGVGTGSMAMVFAATVANRWFVRHRGLVTGVLTAAGATGQLIFLPAVAGLTERAGWRIGSLVIAGAALAVVPLVLGLLRDRPADLGLTAYGANPDAPPPPPAARPRALGVLRDAARTRPFWLLAAGFAICGATTNGLIGTHFIPAAHDHGMPATTAAGLLALIGIFDIIGTVGSGWLTDRVDSRLLLGVYYGLRGLSLLLLPGLFAATTHPSMLVFILFYGLDWVATVPPTVALCRQYFGQTGTIVFGWVFASHQVGAAIAATAAGAVRDALGDYFATWLFAGGLSILAAGLSVAIRHGLPAAPVVAPESGDRSGPARPPRSDPDRPVTTGSR
jgi:MFS family permease